MKKTITLALMLFSISLFAKEVPKEVALKAATFYFKERCVKMGTAKSATEPVIQSVYAETSGSRTLYYVVNYQEGGFVIIAGDDASTPILGYSTENSFDKSNASPAMIDWFTIYEESLKELIQTKAAPSAKAKAEWARITDPNAKINPTKAVIVEPLLSSLWNQTQYYNTLCPYDPAAPSGYDSHVPNGCVALSTSQVIFYHRYPATGTGTYSYTHNKYGTLTANYGATNYDWNAMTNTLTNYNTNVAQLIYQMGVAVNMNYTVSGSGSQTIYAVNALKNYFGYSSNISYKFRSNYPDDANWISLYKSQLDQRLPMINSGSSAQSGGHAFNCDGYDDQDYFHYNWGWGGSGNGYFLLTNLNPNGNNFNENQITIINIYPQIAPTACETGIVLTAKNGTLEDGSRSANYADNLDCQWLIAPTDATAITFTFDRLNTEANADSIVFYSGETTASPVYATFSGNTIPASFTINSDKVLVRFITNGSTNDNGWLFDYSATTPANYCSSIKVLSTPTGTVTDGSDVNNYRNTTYCRWYIQPTNATNITLTFTDFNLSNDDQLFVFNRANTTSPILMNTLTGSSLPSAIYCASGKMGLTFQADNKNVSGGFTANWDINAGVNEITGVSGIALFPNPATTNLKINMQLENSFEGTINILDISGRTVYSTPTSANAGEYTQSIDISDMAPGLYLINIKGENGQQISMKFSKQ